MGEQQGRWGVICLGLGIVLAGIAVLLWRGLSLGTGKMPRIGSGGQTAREAYGVLSPWLATWHNDAGIVSCVISVSRGSDSDDEGWTFQVYSPERGRMALVRVQGQDIQLLRESGALYSLSLLNTDMWRVDSSDVLRLWWRHGGEEVWERPESASLHLRLGVDRDKGPLWQVIVVQGEEAEMAVWEISADTGEFIEREGGAGGLP